MERIEGEKVSSFFVMMWCNLYWVFWYFGLSLVTEIYCCFYLVLELDLLLLKISEPEQKIIDLLYSFFAMGGLLRLFVLLLFGKYKIFDTIHSLRHLLHKILGLL